MQTLPALADPQQRQARGAACAAAALGVAYAAISAYWALGGTWLLSTVGGSLERVARGHRAPVEAGLWAVVLLKLVASALPLASLSARLDRRWTTIARRLTIVEAVILTLYGLVLSAAGWLVQAGVIAHGAGADRRALAWHAFLWDPWFLAWGLLVCATLWRSASRRRREIGSFAR